MPEKRDTEVKGIIASFVVGVWVGIEDKDPEWLEVCWLVGPWFTRFQRWSVERGGV